MNRPTSKELSKGIFNECCKGCELDIDCEDCGIDVVLELCERDAETRAVQNGCDRFTKVCDWCSTVIEDEFVFCPGCGHPIKGRSESGV